MRAAVGNIIISYLRSKYQPINKEYLNMERQLEKEIYALRKQKDFVQKLEAIISEGCKNYLKISI